MNHRLRDRSETPTEITALGSPCRSIAGCCEPEVPGTGRCKLHQSSRYTPAPTVGRLVDIEHMRREAKRLAAIAAIVSEGEAP